MPPLSQAEKTRLIEKMCDFIPHSMLQGIRLEQIDEEEVTMRLPYRPELVGNPESGAVHSGALTELLDHTLGTAGICCNAVGAMITPTLDLRIDHLRVAPAGRDILFVLPADRKLINAWQENSEVAVSIARAHFLVQEQDRDAAELSP